MKNVVILDDYQEVALEMADWARLGSRASVKVVNRRFSDRNALKQAIAQANVLVCNRERTRIDRDLIADLPDLELIVTSGMQNKAIDIAAANERGIPVCGTAMLGYPTVELTWALILAFFRNLPSEIASLKAGGWQVGLGHGLQGKTLGIVGYGRIGKGVAKAGLGFGMNVLALSRSLTADSAAADGVQKADLDTLLAKSDVVSLHLNVNSESRGLIGAKQFERMKNTALFVNTARSILIDETALVEALTKGTIGGAALDVFDEEPLPNYHPLLSTPKTLLTPHLGYVTEENYRASHSEALENIEAWLDGSLTRVLTA